MAMSVCVGADVADLKAYFSGAELCGCGECETGTVVIEAYYVYWMLRYWSGQTSC